MKTNDKLIIGLDFDGTLVTHDYPRIGQDIGAVPVLKKLANAGCLFVLNTMRSGKELDEAVEWCLNHDIMLYGINKNPEQHKWTSSPKVYANLYVDDAAVGCPLKYDGNRPYVDWDKIQEYFIMKGILKIEDEPTVK